MGIIDKRKEKHNIIFKKRNRTHEYQLISQPTQQHHLHNSDPSHNIRIPITLNRNIMLNRNPILGRLRILMLRAASRIARRGVGIRSAIRGDGRHLLVSQRVHAAEVQEVAVGVGGAVRGAVVFGVFEAGAGPDGGEGEGDDDKG